jgi:hypothetical protein
MRKIALFLCLVLSFNVFSGECHKVPMMDLSPGDICSIKDPDFLEYRYEEGIAYCERRVWASLRDRVYELYGIDEENRHRYTIDHIIPLSIGGSNDIKNLWAEHKDIRDARRPKEFRWYLQLSRGEITQVEAIKIALESKHNPNYAPEGFCDKRNER